jgi:AcrR family transcriptional regulator
LTDQSVKEKKIRRKRMETALNKKQKIILVALDLFLKKGFANTSVNEIVNKAEISKGSFYNYFDSKDKLLEEIVKGSIRDIGRELKENMKVSKDPLSAMQNYFQTNIELSRKYTPAILISLREAGIFPISGREKLATLINREIRSAIKEFLISVKGSSSEEEVSMLWGVTLSVWIDITFNNTTLSIEKLAKIVWEGLRWKI